MKKTLLLVFTLISLSFKLSAQDITKGTWYNEEKTARVQFYETNGKIFGKIVWLKDPLNNGKPRTDEFNPNAKLKSAPLMGLVFLKNFKKDGEKAWEDGSIYDPKNGKTYSSNMKLVSPTQLDVRGYIGISLMGRTSKFTKAD
ncbi:DUF2147 domain-containing protein [Lacihabitans sp. LS3-19]|uniref:DUF2147 domain-containing protein n=1 Tax=Lacihabitans sp. LS3-19 TaxID=2487335 RepID=UPI0020CF7FE6|nr:DUF2147 domain-containing protein [Lacihabitans sp. LS3-19]MCP9769861.1 DUF2147 domain-containing protein [Lacihabitans sp. LS3-19]